jgi:hypothetical protein
MPNTFLPADAAKVALNLVRQDSYLTALVSNNYQDQFLSTGRGNAPVQITVPTTLFARSRATDATTAIVLDNVAESTKTFNLDKVHDYSAVPLTEYDLSLGLKDFSSQILAPQAEGIVESLEHKVATTLRGVPEATLAATFDPAHPEKFMTRVRKHLRDNGVAQSGLQVVVGTEVYAAFLDAQAITDASQSGSTEALREGNIGRIRGFTIVESNRLDENEMVAFHRDAVTLMTRAPAAPQGASFVSSISEGGFSLRYLRDYDANTTQDRSIVSTFSGVGILPTYRLKRDEVARTAALEEVPNGGILHFPDVFSHEGATGE